jgi:hypothetical protein
MHHHPFGFMITIKHDSEKLSSRRSDTPFRGISLRVGKDEPLGDPHLGIADTVPGGIVQLESGSRHRESG